MSARGIKFNSPTPTHSEEAPSDVPEGGGPRPVVRRASKLRQGGQVFTREEQLSKRVGPLPANWEKKMDPVGLIAGGGG